MQACVLSVAMFNLGQDLAINKFVAEVYVVCCCLKKMILFPYNDACRVVKGVDKVLPNFVY